VLSNPHAKKVIEAFSSLDLLVFRDLFLTESAKLAHYILPAASFLERSELHFHSYRQMVTMSTQVLEIPGVQTEYEFWHELAHRLGLGESYFPWEKEEDALKWILEPTGIGIDELKKHPQGFVYRPMKYKKYRSRPFPTPSGKYEFASMTLKQMGYPEVPEYQAPAYLEQPDSEYPLVLITGARLPLYLHSRYRNIERFKKVVSEPGVEIHPQDAKRLGIEDGERVRVISEIGAVEVKTEITQENAILPGVVQISHGWDEANVNLLTDDRQLDPISGFPNLKLVPVKIERKTSE
ncbi:MAG: molybdopterin-dependent oxidoreductase, partial [Deltaproteobacteria bacterium]|nr:molybdopterin-dependent oxidoreductase [Deltaproteobacteria bacterium]